MIVLPIGILLSPLSIFDKEASAGFKVFGVCVLVLELTALAIYLPKTDLYKTVNNFQPKVVTVKTINEQKNTPNEAEAKKITEKKRAAEIERNRKNAEENKRKMEELYGKQKNPEEKQTQSDSIPLKQKMDMLIPISVKCKWKEDDVREAVRVIESCGVNFNSLSTKNPAYDSSKNQFSFTIQDSLYDSSPLLHVRVNENHISRIVLEITSNTATNYFREKSNQRIEPFKHTYSSDTILYVNDGEQELVNKNIFEEIIFSRTKLDKMKAQINNYVKSKGGNGIENFKIRVSIQFETDTYNNPTPIPTDELINGKVLFLWQVDYSTKSEVYGKEKDKYHAEILIDGDNAQEISLREI